MDKEYNITIEKEIQKKWLKEKIYKFNENEDREKRPPYIIDTPPPYPTGKMHLGHGLNWTYMDIIARFKRMNNYNVMFPQGWDCHGLPTEVKVEEIHGITKTDIDRQKFRELCIELTNENIEKMREQINSLGISIDWDNEYITMSPEYVRKSQLAFIKMYKDNLVYRGKHPVNWCPRCQTAIAFAEVDYINRNSYLNHIKFPYVEDENKYLEIATSRPELMAACVGIVVNSKDERYKDIIGKYVKVPLFNSEVKVYGDNDVEMDFGTGVVMVCTFGDKTDVIWVNRHNLEVKEAINEKGELTDICGKYAGLPTEEAKKQIIEDLKKEGYLIEQKPLEQNVGGCWRCKTPIEIIVGDQWFVNVKDLLDKVEKATNEIKWTPEHMKSRLLKWISDMGWDWCISRQRLFATPIPVWYCKKCGEIIVAKEEDLPIDPTKQCPYTCSCGNTDLTPETDVLDTWMDSSITPMAITKWEENNEIFNKFYPVQLRPQGHDIIRTWAFYTIIKSVALTDKKPWNEIVINGMVFGEDGYKMSKSRGNVVEPLEITKDYGADALRLWASNSTIGNDVPFAWKEVDYGYRFLRKFWNASRFAKMNLDNEVIEVIKNINKNIENNNNNNNKIKLRVDGLTISLNDVCSCCNNEEKKDNTIKIDNFVDLWILSKLNKLIKKVTNDLENYKFNTINDIIKFVWNDLCDNYIEMVKYRLYNKDNGEEAKLSKFNAQYTLYTVITNILKIMTPFTPHFCDAVGEIYKIDNLHHSWSFINETLINNKNEEIGEIAKNTIASIRRYKSNKGMPLNKPLNYVEIYTNNDYYDDLLKVVNDIRGTLNINELKIINGKPNLENKISEITPNKSKIGPEFKQHSREVMEFVKNANEEIIEKMLNEGYNSKYGLLTKEHIKEIKRALYNNGEPVESIDIDNLIDTICVIQ